MLIELDGGSRIEGFEPGMYSLDPVTLVDPSGRRMSVSLGSVLAQTPNLQLPQTETRSGWNPKDHPRGPDGKFAGTGIVDVDGNSLGIGQVVTIGNGEGVVVGASNGKIELQMAGIAKPITVPGNLVKVSDKDAKDVDGLVSDPAPKVPQWRQDWESLPEPDMSPRQRKAAFAYVHDGYKDMNKILRDSFKHELGEGPKPNYDLKLGNIHGNVRAVDASSDLEDLIEQNEIDRPIKVYRGISLEGLENNPDFSLKPGGSIYDPAFLSTSMNRNSADWFIAHEAGAEKPAAMIEIDVPAGAKGIKLPEDLGAFSENEILFSPGTTLKISEVTQGKDGRTRHIRARLETR